MHYDLAFTRLTGFNLETALFLYRSLGSGRSVYEHRHNLRDVMPDVSDRLIAALQDWSAALARAEQEMAFIEKHKIQVLTLPTNNGGDTSPTNGQTEASAHAAYPQRLAECPDAPIVLYYLGNADLNQRRIIDIVGTRHCTAYGQDLIRHFVSDLRSLCPEVLIVSGLAYGVDINAHRQALSNGFETVGVLAHGLDEIYPPRHRETATQMISHGGLLTEHMSEAFIDKLNFVRRNRIVAGMSDATILVESAAKGGGLITTRIAQDYGRGVFAFPGAVGATFSEGCNNLIRDNGAQLISNATDFVNAMGWQDDQQLMQAKRKGIERDCFPNLSPEEQTVVEVLCDNGDTQLNILAVKTNMNIGQLTSLLFQLEMKGVVRPLAGGSYHLLR